MNKATDPVSLTVIGMVKTPVLDRFSQVAADIRAADEHEQNMAMLKAGVVPFDPPREQIAKCAYMRPAWMTKGRGNE